MTGPLSKREIDDRSAVTANLVFVPPAFNEDAVRAAGLSLIVVHDRTDAVAGIASRWGAARERYAEAIKRQEGTDWFPRRQCMLAAAAELARTRRLRAFFISRKRRLGDCHLRRPLLHDELRAVAYMMSSAVQTGASRRSDASST
jgi:hypothetical protein